MCFVNEACNASAETGLKVCGVQQLLFCHFQQNKNNLNWPKVPHRRPSSVQQIQHLLYKVLCSSWGWLSVIWQVVRCVCEQLDKVMYWT